MATIGSEFARQVVKYPLKGKANPQKPPFWDKYGGETYSQLNAIIPPSDEAIQKFQMQKLTQIADIEIAKQIANRGRVAEEINKLFLSGEINSALSKYEQEENSALDQVITNWIKMLNEGYAYSGKDSFNEKEYERIQNYLQRITNELTKIIQMLGANNNKILGSYLDELKSLMDAANFSPTNVTNWVHHMAHLKGDTVEQIGKEWFSQKGIPNIKSIVTGALEYRGKKYSHQGQLIQDLMLIQIDSPEILDSVKISYTIAGNPSDKREMSLGKFLNMLDGLNKDAKHIMLTDEGYENLMKYSALNIQAKAGINQLPWNKNASTSVSIADFTDETGGLALSARRVFQLLQSLNSYDPPEPHWELKDTANAYQALANFGLATALAKVLHLEADFGNQYLLTPQGFISFPERMKQLFKEQRYKAYMQGQINLNDSLSKPHTVNITGHT